MKTRRNHRKTTTGRHRRVVKQQRGKTHNYHHRKGTVSSGRRHKFFKRGGQFTSYRTGYSSIDSSITAPTYKELTNIWDADKPFNPDKPVDDTISIIKLFVEGVKPINVENLLKSYEIDVTQVSLTVKEKDKIPFSINHVNDRDKQVPVNRNGAMFYIDFAGNTVVIYVDGVRYGYVMVKLNGIEYDESNRGIYNIGVSRAIILDLILSRPS